MVTGGAGSARRGEAADVTSLSPRPPRRVHPPKPFFTKREYTLRDGITIDN